MRQEQVDWLHDRRDAGAAEQSLEQDLHARICRELPHLSAEITQDLGWAVGRLVEAFQPEQVYVFGSQAHGTPGPNSDIDLLVVVSDTDEPLYRLDQQGYGVLEPYRLPIELVFITRGDFERRLPTVASLPATSCGRDGCCMQPSAVAEAQDWLGRADEHMAAVERLLQTPPPLLATSAYHAQQAGEKPLKAFLAAHNVAFRRRTIWRNWRN